jgi:hypothetical protein
VTRSNSHRTSFSQSRLSLGSKSSCAAGVAASGVEGLHFSVALLAGTWEARAVM